MSFRMSAEWAPHEKIWIGFPWDRREWPRDMEGAQREIAAFANAVHGSGGEAVTMVAGDAEAAGRARQLCDDGVTVEQRTIGDIWLRDTGCITVRDGSERRARDFRFNGWGGKYLMEGDQDIGRQLAIDAGLPVTQCDWILEGGAIDVDGEGLAVTTEQCLLNTNRNPGMTREDVEAALRRDLGIERLLWLGNGLTGDHTDGHVDNLARFVAPGHLLLPHADDVSDPNHAVFADALKRAQAFDVQISTMPSPGPIDIDGEIAPASYMNFCIANNVVIMPVFGCPHDDNAATKLAEHFPNRRVIALPSNALLLGGGSFHCCSQQVAVSQSKV